MMDLFFNECDECKELNEYFSRNYPERKGTAICLKCMDELGLVPMKLDYQPNGFSMLNQLFKKCS
jgi:hypothetical protein